MDRFGLGYNNKYYIITDREDKYSYRFDNKKDAERLYNLLNSMEHELKLLSNTPGHITNQYHDDFEPISLRNGK